jgi:hypothetical protein
MKWLVLILAIVSSSAFTDMTDSYQEIHGDGTYTYEEVTESKEILNKLEPEIKSLQRMAILSNTALRAMIKIGTKNLRKQGHILKARQIEREWKGLDGVIIEIANNQRNIGDFEPLSEWLDTTYETLEAKLGLSVCEILRLTDIKTFNFGLRVVFRPCIFGEDEFYKHFVQDYKYKGVAPVASYWATNLSCAIATYSVGYFFICSPLGILVEQGVKNKLAPWAAPKIFKAECSA